MCLPLTELQFVYLLDFKNIGEIAVCIFYTDAKPTIFHSISLQGDLLGSYAALQQLYRIDTIFYLVIAKVEIGWARGCTKIVEYSNLISFINELENGKLKTSTQNECGE